MRLEKDHMCGMCRVGVVQCLAEGPPIRCALDKPRMVAETTSNLILLLLAKKQRKAAARTNIDDVAATRYPLCMLVWIDVLMAVATMDNSVQ